MRTLNPAIDRRSAFTLVELIVVIGIILVIAALAAAFAPSVSDSQNLTRAVDQLEQWLLTAKMRAKRDGLATGIRFIPDPNDQNPVNPTLSNSNTYSQFQYIQQPDPLSGSPGGGPLLMSATTGTGMVTFTGVDFSLGGTLLSNQWLVQPGDYLEVRDGGVYSILSVTPTTLQLGTLTSGTTVYDKSLSITTATANYRILRQPRILIGEPPLQLANNMVVDMNTIPGTLVASNVQQGLSGYLEILFSPSGAIVGTNAGNGKIYLCVHDSTDLSSTNPLTNLPTYDTTKAGIVAVQCRTGFIGAYGVAPPPDPFTFAESGRESGL